ncbi:GFA family protein [Paraburkholderia sp. CNPSo 3157]|uniref:GFA family protein n=1 Tax=Paraburkholderia franconis TaxID=2654983 RepID=A0A7X1N571_9BURK|nr:GFA family protein [Paraburkholderia franconis]MPW15469.1 GFA family protein [Paraburkholderia franconis]
MSHESQQQIHEGGCACGAVRFRAVGAPIRVGMCHCMTCRRVHGSAFGSYAIFRRDAVAFTGSTREWRSSEQGRRHFCPACGSVAFMMYADRDEIDVPLGAFDETGLFEPAYELWCIRKEPWLPRGVRPEYDAERTR